MEWDEDIITRLRVLWAEGHSTAEIGRRMGVSKNAVVGKAHRLKLPPRPSPIRRDGEKNARRRLPRRTQGPTLPALSAASATGPSMEASRLDPRRDAHPIDRSVAHGHPAHNEAGHAPAAPSHAAHGTAPLLRAVPTSKPGARIAPCCWPIGEPGTRSFRFCDDHSLAGKPYCEKHAALAYVKVRDRREDAA